MNSETETGYKYLFDTNPLPLLIFNRETLQILEVNSAALELYGYSYREFLDLKISDLLLVDSEIEFKCKGQGTGTLKVYHRKKDRSTILLEVNSKEISFDDNPAVLQTIIQPLSKTRDDELRILFSSIIESSDDGIICNAPDGKIVSWNRRAEKLYGYKQEEVIGKDISIIVPPEKKEELRLILEKLERGEKIDYYETKRVGKDGKVKWISISISPVKDSDGRIIGAASFESNISNAGDNIAKLKEDQVIFKHLIENLSEIFYVSDPRKPEIIYMSDAYEKVFGEPAKSIFSNPVSYLDYIVNEDHGKAYRALSKQRNGIATDYTYRIKRSDGKIRYLHERAFPVKDDSGNVFRVIGIAEDITEGIESGEELSLSEYRYRSIFESSAVSMWESDYSEVFRLLNELKEQGLSNYRKYFIDHPEFVDECYDKIKVVNVNPQTIKIFKAENKAFLVDNFKKIRTPEYLSVFFELLIVLANGGRHFEAEYELKKFTGEPVHIYSILSFPEDDAPYRYTVTSLIDITERKITESALSESEQRFRVMADIAPVFIWTAGVDKGFYYFNKPWLDFRKRNIEDEIGYNWMKGIHPLDLPSFKETFEESFHARKEFQIEYRVKRFDGEYRWILNHGVPRYSTDGIFQGYIGSGMDITERIKNEVELSKSLEREQKALFQTEQVQRKLEFLAEASIILNSSLNYIETIQSLARLLTPVICDWFAVDILNEDKLERLVVYHKDHSKIQHAINLQKKYPPNLNAATGVPNVIRTGKSELYRDLSDEFLKANTDEELFNIYMELGLKSIIIVPLSVRNKVLGTITLCTAESERTYTESDLKFAEDIAYRAAIAIENARLFRKIEELNKNLERTNRQQLEEIKIRKKIEKELRESEERFRLITENSNDFISLLDENDFFLYANPAITKVLGYSDYELVGKISPNQLVHPEDKELTKSYGNHSIIELRFRRKDGAYVWVESSSLKVNYHGKKIIVRISRDITERKRIENERIKLYAQLEAQRSRIDNLIANVPGVVWEAWGEPDNPDQKMDFVSEYVEKLLGYTVEEWLNTPNFWLKIVHPDDRENAVKEAKYKFENKKAGINRFRWMAKDGREIWVESQSACICDDNGKVIGMRGVNMDITEQIKFEQQLSASLKEKEILLKEIHHRVKNNMQVISSLLSLQSKNIPDRRVQEIFDESRNRIRSMALIHEKLYQSKNLFEIDFYSYVVDLINNLMISYGIRGKDIRSKINIENICFDIDSAITLGLIINELASNSFKHAFKEYKGGIFEVAVVKQNDNYILKVKDNGAGIPENLDIKKSKSLGLQLVQTLIEQLYGTCEMHNNGGTEVILNFPDPSLNEVKVEIE